jgi:hypothetical protein
MDGAISDGEGAPFPLVTTTSDDVIGNFRSSLRSYVAEGGERRKAVLATSVQLKPRRRQNLMRAAAEAGFKLIQIHDQAAFADLLYRSPEWCRELLELTGQPPALSALPLTSRPLLTGTLIGRNDDIAWLCDMDADALVVGQPGTGKTFLLRALVERGEGLFVISDDSGRIAESLRAQEPKAVFIDDAHLKRDLLVRLLQLRAELHAGFRIVGTCWPGEQGEVATALGIPKSAVRELALLTRREIADVIQASGIRGPSLLIRELIDQAKGRPGLAVTLCHLCRRDGTREIVTAGSLFEDLRHSFSQLVGPHAIPILASFSVGGARGMQMADVARVLGTSLLSLHEAVSRLAAGGVLSENRDRSLEVQPVALRHALIRAVFYGGAGSLPIEPLVALSHAGESAICLIGARGRGADVPHQLIRGLLTSCDDTRAWRAYASLGRTESQWVIEHRPELLTQMGWIALQTIPDVVIPRMLSAAVADRRPLNAHPEHPLRLLRDWVEGAVPGEGEAVSRREALLNATCGWYAAEEADSAVCLHALASAFLPTFEDQHSDPVDQMSVTLRTGALLLEEMEAVTALWPVGVSLLRSCGLAEWGAVHDLIREWVYRGIRTRGPVEPAMDERMDRFARTLAVDVLGVADQQPGVRLWIARLGEQMGWDLNVELDPDFEVLFPERDRSDYQAAHREQAAVADILAARWSLDSPVEVARRLVRYANAGAFAGLTWPVWTAYVARRIAETTLDPIRWAYAMMNASAAHDVVQPFLERAMRDARPGWQLLWIECYDIAALRGTTILLALTQDAVPESILRQALSDVTGMAEAIGTNCLRGLIREDRVLRLLQHPDPEVVTEVAEALWHADPEGTVPSALQDVWRTAIIEHAEIKHTLEAIFAAEPPIALEWLTRRVGNQRVHRYTHYEHQAFSKAIEVVGRDGRLRLLDHLAPDMGSHHIVRDLVGRDAAMYRDLLSRSHLKWLHLAPLADGPDEEWSPLALLALNAGYSVNEVADAVRGMVFAWGSEAEMWESWAERFRPLREHPDARVRQIGAVGVNNAENQRDRARRGERAEAVHGRRDEW